MKFIENIFNIIISPDLQRALLPLKIVVILFSFLLLGATIYFLLTTSYLNSLYFNDWKDYKNWRENYGPEAVKKKKMLLKQRGGKAEDEKEEKESEGIPFDETKEERKSQDTLEAEDLRKGRIERTDWERVLDRLEAKGGLNYKLALIDADKIFIKMLAKYGKEFSPEAISNFDDISEAKQVLEKMLSNPKAILTKERAKELIVIYGQALREIGEIN